MYVAVVPNRNSPPAILLRESYREGGKVKNRTLANLTSWPPDKVAALRQVLKGTAVGRAATPEDAFEIVESLPHGHVAAVLGTMRRLGLPQLIDRANCRRRNLCLALIAGRLLELRSKLSTSRALRKESAESSLGEVLGVEWSDEDELYEAMDWLVERQQRIEQALAKRHLVGSTLVLYDLTSTYFEGRTCPLARRGYSRDGKKGKLQIVFGLLTDAEGRPIAVEVFDGNTADPKTVAAQVVKLRERFGIEHIVVVGDRGMLTAARVREDLQPAGLDWITSLRAPAVAKLVGNGSLQLSLFDDKDLAEISDPDYPGERLIVCRNPLLAADRARKRIELVAATEVDLAKVQAATRRVSKPLRGRERIGLRVGRVLGRYKVGKHFEVSITDDSFTFQRREGQIAAEAALDGFYVVRTSLPAERLGPTEVVRSYKSLSNVERAFRSMKTVTLEVRPIYHHDPDRVRAHVFICMMAYYVEWHMRRDLAPLLFQDEEREAAQETRASIVAPAPRSQSAKHKDRTHRTPDGFPVHSFRDLLRNLATITRNQLRPTDLPDAPAFTKITKPSALQLRTLELLQIPTASL